MRIGTGANREQGTREQGVGGNGRESGRANVCSCLTALSIFLQSVIQNQVGLSQQGSLTYQDLVHPIKKMYRGRVEDYLFMLTVTSHLNC